MNASRSKILGTIREMSDAPQADSALSPIERRDVLELLESLAGTIRLLRDEVAELSGSAMNLEAMLTTQDVAELFNCSVDRVQEMQKNGLRSYKNLGKGARFLTRDVVAFRERNVLKIESASEESYLKDPASRRAFVKSVESLVQRSAARQATKS
jgi:hypothetical protein